MVIGVRPVLLVPRMLSAMLSTPRWISTVGWKIGPKVVACVVESISMLSWVVVWGNFIWKLGALVIGALLLMS